ncbi:unnamed protein product [Phytophthora fragariaefolia]|uniref:Unnamed protein product n=1 Tax=Phytophthora fragariaefolia TaxID=1490495 RepID=A0A9W6YCD5_9STRA|nr:unnamed protein product [Phytophthora fragariaefolia]
MFYSTPPHERTQSSTLSAPIRHRFQCIQQVVEAARAMLNLRQDVHTSAVERLEGFRYCNALVVAIGPVKSSSQDRVPRKTRRNLCVTPQNRVLISFRRYFDNSVCRYGQVGAEASTLQSGTPACNVNEQRRSLGSDSCTAGARVVTT